MLVASFLTFEKYSNFYINAAVLGEKREWNLESDNAAKLKAKVR